VLLLRNEIPAGIPMKFSPVEGNRLRLDGGAMFGNVPKEMWKKWVESDDKNRIPLASRSLLVQTGTLNILFDVGIGAFFEPKLKDRFGVFEEEHELLKNLKALGLEESDIDMIVLSHLHFDHVGGLLPAYGEESKLLFPNANIYLSRAHWEHAKNPPLREHASFIPDILRLLEGSSRLHFVEGDKHKDFQGLVRFSYSNGHTVGLMLSTIEDVTFVSDLIPGTAWIHLPVVMGYDRFPELTVKEKEALLKGAARLFLTHDPHQAWINSNNKHPFK